jgi:hypothetical protein
MISEQEHRRVVENLKSLVRIHSARAKRWCPIVSSTEIRKHLIDRCNEVGVSIYEVAQRVGIKPAILKKQYVEAEELLSTSSLRAEDIINIGHLLNTKIRVRVFPGDIEEVDRSKLLNQKFIYTGKGSQNKESR